MLTEQYPQGLGPTVPELGAQDLQAIPKTCFSMVPAVRQELDSRPQLRSVLLCGIEAQACILVRRPGTPDTGSSAGAQGFLPFSSAPTPSSLPPEHHPGPPGSGPASACGSGCLLLAQVRVGAHPPQGGATHSPPY